MTISQKSFLGPDATDAQLIHATAANHRDLFLHGSGETQVQSQNGLLSIYTPQDSYANWAFPRLAAQTAHETIDAAVAECRALGAKQICCWSLVPPTPRDLGARLAARGFEWGWKPHWMALDLYQIRGSFPGPPGLTITTHEDDPDWDVKGLPYYSRPLSPTVPARLDGRHWRFGAWLDGKIVGQSALHLTNGRYGIAGIYHVGVIPKARNQGIGRAISLAACQFARTLGCHWATLNAATHIYERLGFVSLGWGQTWFMHAPALASPPQTPSLVAFAEAVGRGDFKTLDTLALRGKLPVDLDTPFVNGMTAMEMAIRPGKMASVEWLQQHGATFEIVHALNLDRQERIPTMLSENPGLVNRRLGAWQTTPLHEAVLRGDIALVRLLLTAKPDLTIQDTQFRSTALGWAQHFGHGDIAALLQSID